MKNKMNKDNVFVTIDEFNNAFFPSTEEEEKQYKTSSKGERSFGVSLAADLLKEIQIKLKEPAI